MSRRSTRVIKKMNVEALDVSSEHEVFVVSSDDEQDEDPVEKKGKGKKRKTVARTAAGQPPAKRPRGKRWVLSELLEMPYDIVFEVFSQLNPIDLLNLMRTSKDLRSFFRSRANSAIWKAARHHFPGLPECPDDLSEPQYADLAFGKSCQLCLRKVVGLYTFWSARVKVCNKCFISNARLPTFVMLFSLSLEYYSMSDELRNLVPTIEVLKPGRSRHYARKTKYYCQITMDLFSRLCRQHREKKTDETKALVDEAAKAQAAIFEHSLSCVIWEQQYQTELEKDKEFLIDSRKSTVIEHLREAGWDDEIELMTERQLKCMKDLPEMSKTCQKQLTGKVISSLMPHLEAYMTEVQKARIKRERINFLRQRIPIFQEIVEDYLFTIPPMETREFPNISDLFRHPIVRDAIDNIPTAEFNKASLETVQALLPEIVRDVRSTIRDEAIAIVAAACGESYAVDSDTVLDLATTIFTCLQCDTPSESAYVSETLRFPEVEYHPCARFQDSRVRIQGNIPYRAERERDMDFEYFGNVLGQANWNRYSQITYKLENRRILSEAIVLSGFDPKVATHAQMDAADPIFECVACNNPYEGRATMRWSIVAAHNHEAHVKKAIASVPKNNLPMKLELLNEADAQVARKRMDEQMARERAHNYNKYMTCVHCRYMGVGSSNLATVKEHVRTEHGIPRPTDNDIAPIPSKRFIQSVFFMWPPRDV